tara:strand:+ start:3816 stop:4538 length:723 start_codon:yes stop_codon:yes gene_type:complete
MALPKLQNDVPRYEVTIPSSQNTIKFRPFLVKEQKVLMIAYESQDPRQIVEAIMNCIQSCVHDEIDIGSLATFDTDYLFTQIRSKSVGEKSEVIHKCPACSSENKVTINLNDIKMDLSGLKSTDVDLTDKIKLKLRYPTYKLMMDNPLIFNEEVTASDTLFETIYLCLDSVQTENENFPIKDESKEEIVNFVNSLTTEQLNKMTEFTSSLPSLEHTHDYDCPKCNNKNKVKLRGINDFFS